VFDGASHADGHLMLTYASSYSFMLIEILCIPCSSFEVIACHHSGGNANMGP